MVFQLTLYMPFQFIVHVSKGAPLVSVDVEIGKNLKFNFSDGALHKAKKNKAEQK